MRAPKRPLATLLVVSLAAAACSGGGDGESDREQGADGAGTTGEVSLPECPVGAHEEATEETEIVVWHSFVAKVGDTLQSLTDEYNASQEKVRVRLESQGPDYETTLRKYTEAIASGDLPDVLLIDDPVTQFMADSGTVMPAEACFEAAGIDLDDYLPTPVSFYTVHGALQPAMLSLAGTLLYYNRGHFTEAGLDPDDPPETLDEVRSAAEAIKEAGISETPLVMALQPFLIEFWLTGAGAPIVNNDNGRSGEGATAGAFENETAIDVYTWIAEMHEDGLLMAVPDTPGNVDHFFAIGLEQASMLPDTSTAATSVAAFLEGELEADDLVDGAGSIETSGLDIDASPFPGIEAAGLGQIGGTAWYMMSTGNDAEIAAAFDYMMFMNSVEAQVRWNLEGSFTPWLQAAIESPELQAAWDAGRLGSWLRTAAEQVQGLNPEWPGPLIGPYSETRSAIRDSLDRLILEGQDPEDAVRSANEEITSAVEQYAEEIF